MLFRSKSIKDEAKKLIETEEYSCIVTNEEKIIYAKKQKGIVPLIDLNDFQPEKLSHSCLFDKIIGKAAAMIAINCNCAYVYGEIMSERATELLNEHNIPFEFGTRVPLIKNRDNTGMCPIEQSVLDINNSKDACIAIRQKSDFLKAKAQIKN